MEELDAAASSVIVGITLFVLFSGVEVEAEGRARRERRGGIMVPKWEGACQKPSWSCWNDLWRAERTALRGCTIESSVASCVRTLAAGSMI